MKKRTFLSLAVALSISAVASANPFSDVPAKHWAYDSVTKLEKAGIVEGYGDGTYRGARTMTRYEMAQIIARAMANSEKADAALKAELDKLSVEFAKELKNLGVRVTALENQSQNVKFSGDMRFQYIHSEDGVFAGKNQQEARLRLQAEGKVNDNWTVVGRFEALDDLRSSDSSRSDVTMDKMFVQGDYGKFQTRIGRLDLIPVYGMMYDDFADGAEISWNSDRFYGAVRWLGSMNEETIDSFSGGAENNYDAYMAEVAFLDVVKGLNIRGQYTYFDGKNWDGGIWEAGLDYNFGNSDFTITAAAADATGDIGKGKDHKDTAWFTQLDYKGADQEQVGSWGLFGGYRDFQDSAAITSLTTFNTIGKGWYVGGSLTPAKNIVLTAWFEHMKPQFSSEGDKSKKFVQAELEFFF